MRGVGWEWGCRPSDTLCHNFNYTLGQKCNSNYNQLYQPPKQGIPGGGGEQRGDSEVVRDTVSNVATSFTKGGDSQLLTITG